MRPVPNSVRNRLITLFLALLTCGGVRAEEDAPSLYEVGVGAGAAWLPHYPGSDQERLFAIPIPYLIYRGKILRSDREEGTRARFFSTANFEVTLSGGGALPVSSGGNVAREGMPDLGWNAEIGPKLVYRLPVSDLSIIRLGLASRAVFTSSGSTLPRHLGTHTDFEIDFERRRLFFDKVDLLTGYSAAFISEGVASYFHEVPEAYARANRPTYSAKAGYLASTVNLGIGYETEGGWQKFYAGGSYDFLDGSANAASPLVKSRTNSTFVLGYILVLHHSDKKAQVVEPSN
ncbi:MAG: MipA/OmpV family protein [Bdellovibrionota bacterium]